MQIAYAGNMEEAESPRRRRRRERLQELIAEVGGASVLARETDTPKSHISTLVAGRRGLGDALAAKFEEAYNKTAGWFDMPAENAASMVATQNLSPTPAPGTPVVNVPILANSASMGTGTEQGHEDVIIGVLPLSEHWMRRTLQPTSVKHVRFIHAYGDSMSPTFEDGDIVLVDTGMRDARSIDGIYVIEANERLYIKRVRQRIDGEVEISSDNPTVKTVDVLNGERPLSVLGKVIYRWLGKKL